MFPFAILIIEIGGAYAIFKYYPKAFLIFSLLLLGAGLIFPYFEPFTATPNKINNSLPVLDPLCLFIAIPSLVGVFLRLIVTAFCGKPNSN
jgi:hypothetical protein